MGNQKEFRMTFALRLGALIRNTYDKELEEGDVLPVAGAVLVWGGDLQTLV